MKEAAVYPLRGCHWWPPPHADAGVRIAGRATR